MELPCPGSGSGSGGVAEEGRLQTSDPRAGLREELASATVRLNRCWCSINWLNTKHWTGQSWARITVSSILTAAGSDRVRGHMGTAGRRGGAERRAGTCGGGRPAPALHWSRFYPDTAAHRPCCWGWAVWVLRHVWRFYKMYLLFLDILLKYFLPPWDHRENYSVFFKFRKMG